MKKQIVSSLLMALATVAYVAGVAWFMTSAEKGLFINEKTIWAPIVFLLLFVLSAAVTGGLVLGQPVMLYADGKKKEAVKQFALTLGWLLVILALVLVSFVIKRYG